MSDQQRSEVWRRIKELFSIALDLASEERASFLDEACGGDSALRDEVEALLEEHGREGPVGEALDFSLAEELMGDADPPEARIGVQIGSWKVVEEIGRGGMGVVYLAERADEEFEQTVALKLIKRGMDSDAILRRFLNERKVLASLRHPHIARLYDGGMTEDGVPWFAMEYVEGVPITDYCTENALSIDERLALFLNVCRATQHAHNQLVIHRDLKPSNILVTENGNPRLLDFGLAKVLEDPFGENPTTRPGHRWVTLEYASPEQVRGETIGTPSDTYQLGLILYELLVGKRPYTVKGRSPVEAERVICEVDPPRPSTVVDSRAAPLEGQNRQRLLRGDLDTIIMKALHKEVARRYASAENLADDVKRHRDGLPIRARPDTLSYRAKKFVKRNRWGVVAATVVLITLLAGMASTLWQARRATVNARHAADQQAKAEEVTAFLMGLFEANDPGVALGDTITARELLEQGVEHAESLEGRPELQATLFGVTGQVYHNLGNLRQAEELYRRSLAAWEGATPPSENEDDYTRVLYQLGRVLIEQGRGPEAEPFLRQALQRREQAGIRDEFRRNILFFLFNALHGTNRLEVANAVFEEWKEAAQYASGTVDADAAERIVLMAEILGRGGEVRGDVDEVRRGLTLVNNALSTLRSTRGTNHPDVAGALDVKLRLLHYERNLHAVTAERLNLADSLSRVAVALCREIYPRDHPRLGTILFRRAEVLTALGRYNEAVTLVRESMAITKAQRGDQVAMGGLVRLAYISLERGSYEDAVTRFREIRDHWARSYGEEYLYTLTTDVDISSALIGARRFEEAEAQLVPAYEALEGKRGRSDRYTQGALRWLVNLYETWGKPDEAAVYRARLVE